MPGSPRRKHKHKHRSRSRSPRSKERHRKKKRSHDDSDVESDYEVKKHHKHKHRSHDTSDSEEDSRSHRHRGHGTGREDRDRAPRVKQEPDDREHHHRHRHIKREPGQVKQEPDSDNDDRRQRQHYDRQRREHRRKHSSRFQSSDDPSADQEYGRPGDEAEAEAPVEKEKPNFELSGKLTEETNTYKGVVIKYSEPPEARKPKKRWRLYPFKDGTALPVWHIHRQSAYLMGRDRKVVDIPIDHPSCSKQHSVLQYRLVPYKRDNGMTGHAVRPYIIDLGSTNGTHVNNQRIEAQRYVQLLEKDVLKFGFSSREYVLLHDASKGPEPEDDEGESD